MHLSMLGRIPTHLPPKYWQLSKGCCCGLAGSLLRKSLDIAGAIVFQARCQSF